MGRIVFGAAALLAGFTVSAPAQVTAPNAAGQGTLAAPGNPSAGTVSPGSGIRSGTAASPGNPEVAPPTGLSTARPPGTAPGSPLPADTPPRRP